MTYGQRDGRKCSAYAVAR